MKLVIILSLYGLTLAYEYNSNKPTELNCDCGWRNLDKPGEEMSVRANEYPWIVSVRHSSTHVCTGTIITEWHVMTVSQKTKKLKAADLSVCVAINGNTKCSFYKSLYGVKSINNKWRLSFSKHVNDISILTLTANIEFNSIVGPICLPHKHIQNHQLENQNLKIFSWLGSNYLYQLDVPVSPTSKCINHYRSIRKKGHICTFSVEHHTCKGDEGTPSMYVDSITERYTIIGISSFGPDSCNGRIRTNIGMVSTNVSRFLEWIKEAISDTNDARFCSRNYNEKT